MLAVLNPLLKCRLHGRSLYCTSCSNASVCTAPFTTMSAAMPALASVLNPLLNPWLQCQCLHGCLGFPGVLFCTKSFTICSTAVSRPQLYLLLVSLGLYCILYYNGGCNAEACFCTKSFTKRLSTLCPQSQKTILHSPVRP